MHTNATPAREREHSLRNLSKASNLFIGESSVSEALPIFRAFSALYRIFMKMHLRMQVLN